MLVLALLFLARTVVRPDIELAERAAREQAGDGVGAAGR